MNNADNGTVVRNGRNEVMMLLLLFFADRSGGVADVNSLCL